MWRRRWVWLALAALAVAAAGIVLVSRGPRPVAVDLATAARRDVFRSYVTASGEIVAIELRGHRLERHGQDRQLDGG